MIYVTHDQVEAMTLASRIAVMKGGRIEQIDTPQRVYNAPANMFVAAFLGAPSMNFVHGQLESSGGGWSFVAPTLRADVSGYAFVRPPQPGQAVVLGVRPEDLRLAAPEGAAGQARVVLIEPMGARQIVWLDAQGVSLAVDADADAAPSLGGTIGISLTTQKISLFDAATQDRL